MKGETTSLRVLSSQHIEQARVVCGQHLTMRCFSYGGESTRLGVCRRGTGGQCLNVKQIWWTNYSVAVNEAGLVEEALPDRESRAGKHS